MIIRLSNSEAHWIHETDDISESMLSPFCDSYNKYGTF